MAEYIEREAVLFDIEEAVKFRGLGFAFAGAMKRYINRQPPADVVPVVRCKDCKHWEKRDFQAGNDAEHLEYGGWCPYVRGVRYESDFCSCGERKEGNGDG